MSCWSSSGLFLLLLFYCAPTVLKAANWAETNGVKEQQAALVSASGFSQRYGHACVAVDSGGNGFDYQAEADAAGLGSGIDTLFCIGGDDFDEVEGGGGLKNDVWKTTGANWRIALADSILNEYDDPRVSTVSGMGWTPAHSHQEHENTPYQNYIACAVEEKGFNPPPGVRCQYANRPSSIHFSPRRHHGAVAFKASGDTTTRLYLLGGRSRVMVDYPDGWERVHGGYTDRLESSTVGETIEHWREENMLMNDIWMSPGAAGSDGVMGAEWDIVNPGCMTQYFPFSVPNEAQMWGNGSAAAYCDSNDDCGGDASCDTSRHVCLCNLWSPREQHAVAVYKSKIYVTGGFTWLAQHTCAGRACGGNYRQVLNDVWWSTDAVSWLTDGFGTPSAGWPARAGHQLVVPYYSSLYSINLVSEDSYMYLVGGRSIDMENEDTDEFYGDVWATENGREWALVMSSSSSTTYPARSNHAAAMIDDIMVITSGYDENGARDDTWTWDRTADSETNDRFVEDFSNETDFYEYVNENSPVSVIPMVNEVNEAKLQSLDIYTVSDLAEIESWKVKELQDFNSLDYPDICLHIKWAESILDNCIDVIEPLDYVEWDGTFERADDWDARLKVNQTKSEAQLTEETDFCESMFLEWTGSWTNYILFNQEQPYPFPLKCKSQVGALAITTGVVYQDRLWVIGGLRQSPAGSEKSANVWYREPHIPSTSMVVKPLSETSDQIFEFACSDTFSEWCRYQYRILDMSEQPPTEVRHWCDTNYLLDYGAYWSGGWLPRGDYRLQVRAIGPSGNKESSFQEGRNQHTWTHIPTPPWDIIITVIVIVFLIIAAIIIYYRHKARKAALQRYAMKRMRRKFKRMQKIKAGKLHQDRQARVRGAKQDAVVTEAKINQKREMAQMGSNKPGKRRRRRKGPAVKKAAASAASL